MSGCGLLVLAAVACFGAAGRAAAQASARVASSPVQIQASPQLFAAVGALFASGYDPQPDIPSADPLISRFRGLKGPAVDALRDYLRSHATGDRVAMVSRLVTFALLAGPPPKFDLTMPREELPPEILAMDGFAAVLADFYRQSQMEALWREFQPRYERSQAELRDALTRSVLVTSAYLREAVGGNRRFTVYVEPLLGGQIHVRNIGAEYALVVNPAVNSLDDMRHAFLHFLLDPLVIRYREKLLPEDVLYRIALRAPRLQESLKKDSLAFFAECLVQAVELRMRKLSAAQLSAEVDRAEGDGLVLVRPLMPALAKFEAAEPAMTFYFTDLIKSIDATAERVRLQSMRFPPADEPAAPAAQPVVSEKDRAIGEGDRLIASRDAAGADAAYQRALAMAPNDSRALYGSAVASLMLGQGERAFGRFQQVVAAASGAEEAARPDAGTLAWAHIYLGRLHDLASEREEAIAEYRAALAIAGVPEAARAAAQRGVDQAYEPAARSPSPG